MSEMVRSVSTPCGELSYVLVRGNVKNVNLRIRGDGSVRVSARKSISLNWIDQYVVSKADFIANARQSLSQRERKKTLYDCDSGDTVMWLGNPVEVLIFIHNKNEIKWQGNILCMYINHKESSGIRKRLVDKFIKDQCQTVFMPLVEKTQGRFQPRGVGVPVVSIRNMKSRWGSCLPMKGKITLNSRLIEYPIACIEYVIVHEFCHFLQPNHSRAFYQLMDEYDPTWKDKKEKLNGR